MRVDVVTLFPELFTSFLATGMVGRAISSGALAVRFKSPREFGLGRYRSVDDTPYGGGSGMVMRVDCVVACLEALDCGGDTPHRGHSGDTPHRGHSGDTPHPEHSGDTPHPEAELPAGASRARRVLLTPQGRPFGQRKAVELAALPAIALVCGRYEGIDERVRSFVDEEISLGDFVLTGGEIAAMAIVDACARLLPGVLGNEASSMHESHSAAMDGLLEYPQYTRPVEFRGMRVPEVLQGGNHAAIASWRRAEAERRTEQKRPDLWQAWRDKLKAER